MQDNVFKIFSDLEWSTRRESRLCECTRAVLVFPDLQKFCHNLHRSRPQAHARPARWTGSVPRNNPPGIIILQFYMLAVD